MSDSGTPRPSRESRPSTTAAAVNGRMLELGRKTHQLADKARLPAGQRRYFVPLSHVSTSAESWGLFFTRRRHHDQQTAGRPCAAPGRPADYSARLNGAAVAASSRRVDDAQPACPSMTCLTLWPPVLETCPVAATSTCSVAASWSLRWLPHPLRSRRIRLIARQLGPARHRWSATPNGLICAFPGAHQHR